MTLDLPARFRATELWLVDLRSAAGALENVEALTPRLGPDDEEKIAAISVATVRQERRSAYIALRLLVERAFGSGWRRAPYLRSRSGKPSLPGATGAFSLSHVAGLALIGLSPLATIGVDVERSRPVRISDERRRRIEAAAEALSPAAPLPQAPACRFVQAWVRLEAVAKAEGRGIGPVLARYGVLRGLGGAEPAASLPRRPDEAAPGPEAVGLEIHDLRLGEGLFGAVAMTPGQGAPALLDLPHDSAGLDRLLAEAKGL